MISKKGYVKFVLDTMTVKLDIEEDQSKFS